MDTRLDERQLLAMMQRARAAEAWEPGGDTVGGGSWARYYQEDVALLTDEVGRLLGAFRGARIDSITPEDLDTMRRRVEQAATVGPRPNLNIRQGFATAYAHDVPWLVNEIRNLQDLRRRAEQEC